MLLNNKSGKRLRTTVMYSRRKTRLIVVSMLVLTIILFIIISNMDGGFWEVGSLLTQKPKPKFKPVQEASPESYLKLEQGDRFRRSKGGIASYPDGFIELMLDFVERKVEANDSELVRLVRDFLDPPSTSPMLKLSHIVKLTPQTEQVIRVFDNKRQGFFIESGALDGERSSNTLYLEKVLGWTGLLVEVDPYFYTQLLGKARQSWSINACISLTKHPAMLPFQGSSGGMGRVDRVESMSEATPTVPCFPLETLLLAINQSRVDYLSLDVEGAELDILRTIPFNHVTIDTLSVEYRHGESKALILEYMQQKGYRMLKDIEYDNPAETLFVKDFIFVRDTTMR